MNIATTHRLLYCRHQNPMPSRSITHYNKKQVLRQYFLPGTPVLPARYASTSRSVRQSHLLGTPVPPAWDCSFTWVGLQFHMGGTGIRPICVFCPIHILSERQTFAQHVAATCPDVKIPARHSRRAGIRSYGSTITDYHSSSDSKSSRIFVAGSSLSLPGPLFEKAIGSSVSTLKIFDSG